MTEEVRQEPRIVSVEREGTQVVVTEPSGSVTVTEVQVSAVSTEKVQQIVVEREDAITHVLAVGVQGPPGPIGPSGTAETYVAGQDLGGHRVVVTNALGQAIYADNTNAAHANAATKITTGAASSGDSIEVQITGRMNESSWSWVPGGTIYVGVNGLLTQTVPVSPAAFSKPVAVAETSTRILIIQEPPIILV